MRTLVLVLTATLAIVSTAAAQTGTVRGTVTNSVTGAPVSGATVDVWALAGGFRTTTTGADGTYEFSAVAAGTYVISVIADGYAREYYDGKRSDNADRITVSAGTTVTVDVTLDPLATVRGRVTDAVTGAPIPNVEVLVGDVATTGADGIYSANVPPGDYLLRTRGATGYVDEVHDNIACIAADCTASTGMRVPVAAGATVTVDFVLQPEARVRGTVRAAGSGAGLGGVFVWVYNASGSFVKNAATLASGEYEVTGLAPGTYFAHAVTGTALPYLPELYGGAFCPTVPASPAPLCRPTDGVPIIVSAGATVAGIDFELDLGASIAGTVVASNLQSLAVRVYSGGAVFRSAIVPPDGRYSIAGLPPGSYFVRTDSSSVPNRTHRDEWYNDVCIGCAGFPVPIEVNSGQSVTGIDFVLETGATLTVGMTCPALFLSGPTITAYDAHGNLVANSLTGCAMSSGDYSIPGLAAGTYFLRTRSFAAEGFRAIPGSGELVDELYDNTICVAADCDVRRGTPVQVPGGAGTTRVTVDLRAGGSISGSMPGFGNVRVFDARGVELPFRVRTPLNQGNGAYEAVGLPPGTYYLKREPIRPGLFGSYELYRGISSPSAPPTMGTPVVITSYGEAKRDVNFSEVVPRTISGTVRDGEGARLSTIEVEVYSDAGAKLLSATTDLLGQYRLPNLADGTYYLRTRNIRGFVDRLYADAPCPDCDVRTGTPVTIASADVTNVDFTLRQGASITGVVTDLSGPALKDVHVAIFDATGSLVARGTSDLFGRYYVSVPTGTFYARTDPVSGYPVKLFSDRTCPNGTCDVTTGTPIVTTLGSTARGIDFSLAGCGSITVTPAALASGVEGRAYRQRFTASGGVAPHHFTVSAGSLPPGLSLETTTGVLSGTPTASGRYSLTVAAMDANGCARTQALTLDVAECAFALSSSSASVAAAGATIEIEIRDACGAMDVADDRPWIAASLSTGASVKLSIVVDANPAATPRTGSVTVGRRAVTIRQAGSTSSSPFGSLDIPIDGRTVHGSLAIGGWALDDNEVRRVRIVRDWVAGEPVGALVHIGNAVFVEGARPDVARLYPDLPFAQRAGWGYMLLTNMLPNGGNGPFRIHAYADDVEGNTTLLGSRTIVGINSGASRPFGAIDTPRQGEVISGSAYMNWGWALTQQGKEIAPDGSTIQVYIDGVPLGPLHEYNLFRPDVSGLFPGLANSSGPVGYRIIDTTALADGIHTISWVVTDSSGAAAGIGSRYFIVRNSADGVAPQ